MAKLINHSSHQPAPVKTPETVHNIATDDAGPAASPSIASGRQISHLFSGAGENGIRHRLGMTVSQDAGPGSPEDFLSEFSADSQGATLLAEMRQQFASLQNMLAGDTEQFGTEMAKAIQQEMQQLGSQIIIAEHKAAAPRPGSRPATSLSTRTSASAGTSGKTPQLQRLSPALLRQDRGSVSISSIDLARRNRWLEKNGSQPGSAKGRGRIPVRVSVPDAAGVAEPEQAASVAIPSSDPAVATSTTVARVADLRQRGKIAGTPGDSMIEAAGTTPLESDAKTGKETEADTEAGKVLPAPASAAPLKTAPLSAEIMLTPHQQSVSDMLFDKFRPRHAGGTENSVLVEVRKFCNQATLELDRQGFKSHFKVNQKIESMLARDRKMMILVGGALTAMTGYTAGLWPALRIIMVKAGEAGKSPFEAGFLAGLSLTVIEKPVSSAFTALFNKQMYGLGKTRVMAALDAAKPSKLRTITVSSAMAGAGTFTKNMVGRNFATQITARGLEMVKNVDFAFDTLGSGVAGAIVKPLLHRILVGSNEGLRLIAQEDFADKVRSHTNKNEHQALAQFMLNSYENFRVMLSGGTNAFLLPSNYINAIWWGIMIGTLNLCYHAIDQRFSDPERPDEMARSQAAMRTFTVSALMAVMMGGTTAIALLGIGDQYTAALRGKVAGLGKLSTAGADADPDIDRIEELEDEEQALPGHTVNV